jgi:hypothetical protein
VRDVPQNGSGPLFKKRRENVKNGLPRGCFLNSCFSEVFAIISSGGIDKTAKRMQGSVAHAAFGGLDMIKHLENMELLVRKLREIISLFAGWGVRLTEESWFSEHEGEDAFTFVHNTLPRSDHHVSVKLIQNPEVQDSEEVSDFSFIVVGLFFPFRDDDTADGDIWVRIYYRADKTGSLSVSMDRDAYRPEPEEEAAFAMFPNGDMSDASATAFMEAVAKYYLALPEKAS